MGKIKALGDGAKAGTITGACVGVGSFFGPVGSAIGLGIGLTAGFIVMKKLESK